jgi:hypothetical protein
MPADPYDPEFGWRNPLPDLKPLPTPPSLEGDFQLIGTGGRYPDPNNPGQGGWLRPVEKPVPVPQPTGLIPVLDFRPDRTTKTWVYPTVTPLIPAPRPSLSAISSLTGSILYNNVNYVGQPKLKPIGN